MLRRHGHTITGLTKNAGKWRQRQAETKEEIHTDEAISM
jgi:hypothetical protein